MAIIHVKSTNYTNSTKYFIYCTEGEDNLLKDELEKVGIVYQKTNSVPQDKPTYKVSFHTGGTKFTVNIPHTFIEINNRLLELLKNISVDDTIHSKYVSVNL